MFWSFMNLLVLPTFYELFVVFYIYQITSSRTSDSCTSSFQIYMTFISISCPAAVTGTSSTMLNKSCESGHPCPLPDLKQKLSACHCWVWVAVGLSYVAFFMLRHGPSVSTLMRVFIVNECGILSNAFSDMSRSSYDFYPSRFVSCWLICRCWAILVYLE